MTITQKITYLLFSVLFMIFLPCIGAYFLYDGNFPTDFFNYPPLEPLPKPGFNIYIFTFVALFCAGLAAIYVFPQMFGFKKPPVHEKADHPKVSLPYWFWFGLLCWGTAIVFFIAKLKTPEWFINWSDIPLFWGLTLMLDGWVYVRNGGKSLVSQVPQEIVGIGVASIAGWMIFEFMNFFIDENWYYPAGNIFSPQEFLLYACLISSGLLPLAFEWYCLFKTVPKLAHRFTYGFKIVFSKKLNIFILIAAYVSMFLAGIYPDLLFWAVWTSPPIIIAIVLNQIGVWTPLDSIGKGNWTPTLLGGLTYFVTGLCLECQNYLCATHTEPFWTGVPAYWKYSLPYVDVLHVFEMPLVGLFGYLPFGVYCWLWWIAVATLMNIPARFLRENPIKFDE
jgi:hypothetical protein